MKKRFVLLTVLIIVLVFPVAVIAEDGDNLNPTRKGRIIFDVDFSLHAGSYDVDFELGATHKSSNYGIDLDLGYTIIDNLEVGLFVSFNSETSETKSQGVLVLKQTDRDPIYGLFARYLFGNGKFKPYVGLIYGIGTHRNTDTHEPADMIFKNSMIGGNLGLAYFFNDHFGVEIAAYYVKHTFTEDDDHYWTLDMDGSAFMITFCIIAAL